MNRLILHTLSFGILIFITWACSNKSKEKYTDTITTGVIAIGVDESFKPIIEQEIDVFENIYTLAGISPIYQNEVDVMNLLLEDSVRLAITTRPLTEKEKISFNDRKFFPRELKLATDAIALIINKENNDSLISVYDLRKIMTGEITSWKQLNKQSHLGDIQVVFDNPNSSTVRFAIDSICGGAPLAESLRALKNNQSVIDFVSKTPDAIGVVGVSWIGNKNDSTNLSFENHIRVMGVSREKTAERTNCYKPYQAYLTLGYYPLTRNVYIILNDPRSGLPSGFTSFLTSDRGQRIILRSGMVPATQTVRIVNVNDN